MWYEQDDFWRDNYEVMFSADSFRCAAEDVDRVLSLTGAAPRQVLDLCCGPGRHSIPLAQTGLAVTAVDLSSFLLDAARKNARAAGVSLEFIHSDMRHFLRPRSFDLILHLYSSFGYFDSRDDDMKVLSNMFETLRPGGTVTMDVVGKELIGRRSDRITELPDGSTHSAQSNHQRVDHLRRRVDSYPEGFRTQVSVSTSALLGIRIARGDGECWVRGSVVG